MKLVHPDYILQILLAEGSINSLVIENPTQFFKYLEELYTQINSQEGSFVLSEEGSILKISKYIHFIESPFSIDINQKSVLNKILNLLKDEIMSSNEIETFYHINTKLSEMIDSASEAIGFSLQYEEIPDILNLLKVMNIKLAQNKSEHLVETLIDYLKIVSQILGTKIIVFANMNSYLNADDMTFLKEIAMYEKLTLLFIDNCEPKCYNIYDNKYIIDADLCEII